MSKHKRKESREEGREERKMQEKMTRFQRSVLSIFKKLIIKAFSVSLFLLTSLSSHLHVFLTFPTTVFPNVFLNIYYIL